MNSNTVRARMSISFKGENHELDTLLDLDKCVAETGAEPDFHLLLAKAAGIDPYSYLYEVLETHEIEFLEATGIATLSCRNGHFDWLQFELHRSEDLRMQRVRTIAEQTLSVHDLDQQVELRAALLAAYQAGQGEPDRNR